MMYDDEDACKEIQPQQSGGQLAECEPPSLFVKLNRKKNDLETRLVDVNKAITLFEENPVMQQAIDSLSRINIRY